jgi:hypothetical protein
VSSVAAAEQVTVRACVQACGQGMLGGLLCSFSRMWGDSPRVMLQGWVGSSVY